MVCTGLCVYVCVCAQVLKPEGGRVGGRVCLYTCVGIYMRRSCGHVFFFWLFLKQGSMPESTDIWKSEAEELRARVKYLTIQCQAQQELIKVSLSLSLRCAHSQAR